MKKRKSAFDITDKVAKERARFEQESRPFIGKETFNAALSAVLTVIAPKVSVPILSLLNELAGRRVYERAVDMIRTMNERIDEIGEENVNKEYFKSEEFQTILFLRFEQLRTTHDKEKQRLLASALANSGLSSFSEESRKELFVRILRDLSPQHIQRLKELLPPKRYLEAGPTFWPKSASPQGEELGILQYLAANGLVDEFLTAKKVAGLGTSPDKIARVLQEHLERPPTRNFRISRFGMDFLRYVGASASEE
jgi:hypothetical protein